MQESFETIKLLDADEAAWSANPDFITVTVYIFAGPV
jgi:hypothetical protein